MTDAVLRTTAAAVIHGVGTEETPGDILTPAVDTVTLVAVEAMVANEVDTTRATANAVVEAAATAAMTAEPIKHPLSFRCRTDDIARDLLREAFIFWSDLEFSSASALCVSACSFSLSKQGREE